MFRMSREVKKRVRVVAVQINMLRHIYGICKVDRMKKRCGRSGEYGSHVICKCRKVC